MKIVESNGLLFTGTPSINALDTFGYVESSGDSNNNSGRNYASTYNERGNYGPVGTFGRFDQLLIGGNYSDSISAAGINGQYDRWCQTLNGIGLSGKRNWRRASSNELSSLFHDKGNMYTGYGWATYDSYWSSTLAGSGFNDVHLDLDRTVSGSPIYSNYASCVSAP